jgi:uncharacterized protein YfaS (alpha-2-macroglobulin family)
MTTYQLGETVRVDATITDEDGTATDPATVTVSIRGPDGVMLITDTSMTQDGVGLYHYDYTLISETSGLVGKYTYKVECTGSGGQVTIKNSTFKVEASI